MLRVLLIGNGFDLAHGAPTSFIDFSEYLRDKFFIPLLTSNDPNLNIYYHQRIFNYPKSLRYNDLFHISLSDLIGSDNKSTSDVLQHNWNELVPYLRNNLLKTLYIQKADNWFNIEETYFQELVKIHEKYTLAKTEDNRQRALKNLRHLNTEFLFIEEQLSKYLNTLEIKKNQEIQSFLYGLTKLTHNELVSKSLFVIDFNYTQTIFKYDIIAQNILDYSPIHGTLKDKIILGYGNDKDEQYEFIKKSREDEFLKHFKTHKYLLDRSYQFIIQKLVYGNKKFEVDVLGHSLGLTDKTLLKEIFESKNCQRINLYKRKDLYNNSLPNNNYINIEKEFQKLTIAASRIIDDQSVRKIVKNIKDSDFFP